MFRPPRGEGSLFGRRRRVMISSKIPIPVSHFSRQHSETQGPTHPKQQIEIRIFVEAMLRCNHPKPLQRRITEPVHLGPNGRIRATDDVVNVGKVC